MQAVFTIYSYGLGAQTTQALNAIAAMFLNSGFTGALTKMSLLVGLAIVMYKAALGAIDESGKWIVYVITMTTLAFQPTASVMVKDEITKHEQVVKNVPILISITGGLISTVGKSMAESFDTAFSTVNSFEFHKNGFVFGSKIASEIQSLKVIDPEIKDNLHRFIKNCVIMPAMIGAKFNIKDLQVENDLWNFIKKNASHIRMVFYKDATSSDFITCNAATAKFDAHWSKEIDDALTFNANKFTNRRISNKAALNSGNERDHANNKMILDEIKNNITTTFTQMGGIAKSAEEMIKQQMLINSLRTVPKEEIRALGGNINYATAKSVVQQRTTFQITGELAARYLPIIMSVLQIIAFSVLPFVMCFGLLPGGLKTILNYFEILLWLQTWPPLFAVLNMIMEVTSYMNSGDLISTGYTLRTAAKFSTLNADIIAVAGYLAPSIPFIAYALTKGGVAAFSHIAGSLTAPSQSIAGQVGAELASGNLSLGNVSYANSSALNSSMFKYDSVATYRGGQQEFLLSDGAYQVTQADGSAIFKGGAGYNSSTGVTNFRFSGAIGSSISQQLAGEESNLNALSKQYDRAQSNEFRSAIDFIEGNSKALSNNQNHTIDESTTSGKAIGDTVRLTNSIRDSLGVSESTAAIFTLGISQKLPFNRVLESITGSSGGVDMQFQSTDTLNSQYERAKDIARSSNYDVTYDKIARAAHDRSLSETSGWDVRSSENFSKAYDQRESLSNQQSATYQRVNTLRNAAEYSNSNSFGFDREYNQEYLNYVTQRLGGNSHDAYQIINADTPESHSYQNEFVQMKAQELIDRTGYSEPNFKANYDNTNMGNLNTSPRLQVNDNIIGDKTFDYGLDSNKIDNFTIKNEVNEAIQQADQKVNIDSTNIPKEDSQLRNQHKWTGGDWKKKYMDGD